MESAWKILWALPLVLAIGVGAMLVLRRFVVPVPGAGRLPMQRMKLHETLRVSEHTWLHLVDVDGRSYLVTESEHRAQLQSMLPLDTPSATKGIVPVWLRRLQKAAR